MQNNKNFLFNNHPHLRGVARVILKRHLVGGAPVTHFSEINAHASQSLVKRGIKGFTLIELIMTMVVVSIIAVPLALLLGQHVTSVFQSEDYTMAADLARYEMERVKNMAYANVVSANFPNYQGYNYDVARTVSFVQGTALTPESLKFVRIDIRKSGSAAVLFSLVTYLARNVIYGV